ncbi:MAG TPA: DUF4375 domain-containing protein [Myxococcota bacterium]|nr:DUF4375 domain-containing protein [Myxococcota bacterium]
MNAKDAEGIIQDAVGRLQARCLNSYSALNSEEQTVCFAWLATQVINNGGFQYLFESFFEGDATYEKTAAAFHKIGANAAARAFDQAMRCFPDAIPSLDPDERLSRYEAVPESHRYVMDNSFMEAYGEIVLSLARYIEQAFHEGRIR